MAAKNSNEVKQSLRTKKKNIFVLDSHVIELLRLMYASSQTEDVIVENY